MLKRLSRLLWGHLSDEELKSFGFLSLILFFIIGSYWIFLSLKDSLLKATIGFEHQPMAKIASLGIIIVILIGYSKLLDRVSKSTLFFIICGGYSLIFFALAYFAAHESIGLLNTNITPYRKFGWISYFAFESFGALVVPLFWSFVTNITTTEAARRGFPLIMAGSQIGAIIGPTLVTHAQTIGIPTLLFIGACGILIVPFLMHIFITRFAAQSHLSPREQNEQSNVTTKPHRWSEGLQLVLTRPYLTGILGIVMFHQIVGTILAFQMKQIADAQLTTVGFAEFAGRYGQITNTLALIFILFGTSIMLRRLGLTFCLIMYPAALCAMVCGILCTQNLTLIYWGMVTLKGLGYALHNPSREIIYIPTSETIKFRAKSWIDGFGARSAKASASALILSLQYINPSISFLIMSSSTISLGLLGCWIACAAYIGKAFTKLTENKNIIE